MLGDATLFPNKFSFFIFVLYISLFIGQGILVPASQKSDNKYDYDITSVVLLTEVLKLVLSLFLYLKDNSLRSLGGAISSSRKVLVLYFVPAFLYCLYNNLSFVNLSVFDSTTYFLLLQLRVVVTGILFQFIFKKHLSGKQWLSLLILTAGCMLKQVNFTAPEKAPSVNSKKSSMNFGINTVLLFVQIFCSCLAGVYNEYLLKKPGEDVNIYVQNIYMYIDSIICNLFIILFNGQLSNTTIDSIKNIFHFKAVIVMINNALVGIVTSFFLKNLNSILKTFASALELVFTAILSYYIFDIPIYLNTVLAILIVMYAVYLYSQNPISNVPKPVLKHPEEGESFIDAKEDV